MRAGALVPHMGATSSPEFIVRATQEAESLDYHTAWVAERVLYPLEPQTPYPGSPDGSLPDFYRRVFEPIEALTWVAAHTRRLRVGTSIINMPYHNPVLLARRLATLDVLSGGRLSIGFGQAWSKDELDATGASPRNRSARADEFIAVLKAMWGPEPVEHHGEFFTVPRSIIQPKPIQQPHPPIYMAAYAPSALARVAHLADGWLPTGIPLNGVAQMWAEVRRQATEAGRDPSALKLLVLGHVTVMESPLGEGRADFTGSLDEIRRDVEAARALGTDELILNPGATPSALESEAEYLRLQEKLRALV